MSSQIQTQVDLQALLKKHKSIIHKLTVQVKVGQLKESALKKIIKQLAKERKKVKSYEQMQNEFQQASKNIEIHSNDEIEKEAMKIFNHNKYINDLLSEIVDDDDKQYYDNLT